MWLLRTPLAVFREALRGYPECPEPQPLLPAAPQHKPAEPDCIVVAFHPGSRETYHGPFTREADAEAWARAHLKFSAKEGWEIEPLYAPEDRNAPAHADRGRQ